VFVTDSSKEITRHFTSLALSQHPFVANTPYSSIHTMVQYTHQQPEGAEHQVWLGLTDIDLLFVAAIRASMNLTSSMADNRIASPTWFHLTKMGLYNYPKPPMQAQVQSFRYAACLSMEVTRRIKQLEDTIQSQHGKIQALECIEEEGGGAYNFFLDLEIEVLLCRTLSSALRL
jgi:hypothetical protein